MITLRPRRARHVAAVLFLAVLPVLPAAARAEPKDEPDLLRKTVLDAALKEEPRIRAARTLGEVDPEGLGTALLELAKKKDPHNLPLLVDVALQAEARHVRLAAVYAAWQCAPELVAEAFVKEFAHEDDKIAMRAIEAAGFLVAPTKSKTLGPRLVEEASHKTPLRAIEALRAISRMADKRMEKDLVELCASVPDDHVRKHAVWALQDVLSRRHTEKRLTPLKGRPGDEGKRAAEAIEIVKDEEEEPFTWDPMALKSVPEWWAGRVKDLKPAVDIGDEVTKTKVESWFDHLQAIGPPWRHLLGSSVSKVVLRPAQEDRVVDPKARTWFLGAGEVIACESAWQGSYVAARSACLAFSAALGEPVRGHRGWESAYVEIHTFYGTDGEHRPGTLAEFVATQVSKKGWK